MIDLDKSIYVPVGDSSFHRFRGALLSRRASQKRIVSFIPSTFCQLVSYVTNPLRAGFPRGVMLSDSPIFDMYDSTPLPRFAQLPPDQGA